MKKIIEKEIIPAKLIPEQLIPEQTVEKAKYICEEEGCDFETYNEDDCKKHHGKQHIRPEYMYIGEASYYYFKTERDANLYAKSNFLTDCRVDYIREGWYEYSRDTVINYGEYEEVCYLEYRSKEHFEGMVKEIQEAIRHIDKKSNNG